MDTSFARFHYEVVRVSDRVTAQLDGSSEPVTIPEPAPRVRGWRPRLALLLHTWALRLDGAAARHA